MVVCRFQFDFFPPKSSFYSNCLGLILVCCTTLSFYVQTSSANCRNFSSEYRRCEIKSGGVHALDCFGEHKSLGLKTCEWKSGNQASGNVYTLVLQQGEVHCRRYSNILEFSKRIKVYEKYNMSVEVYENVESTNCSKAVFSASPGSILRCAPHDASFSRRSGKLMVTVAWKQKDQAVVKKYSVRFKAVSAQQWRESPVQWPNGAECVLENLNSSLDYQVQIQCVTNKECSQCVWSQVHTVPAELTSPPVIVDVNDTDCSGRTGQRLLSLTWTFPAAEPYDGFNVTVWKTSGEKPRELTMTTTRPEIRLFLSYSAFYLNISAFNNASSSPAVRLMIPPWDDHSSLRDLNVTIHSNTSLTIYWEDNLIENYVCFSVEWVKTGHKAEHKSFYEDENNYKTLSPLPEPLEPYKRYSITLHTRPNKDTCNMKRINNSESTYGRTHFYFREGTPVSAPRNISSFNVTLHSVMLQWAPIPQEDVRGFLIGYAVYFTEYHQSETSTERNVTVDQTFNTCELENLESDTTYKVQISGVTKAGEGVLSSEILFKTKSQDNSNLTSIIIVMVVLVTVLMFGSRLIERAKLALWPSIPNPGKSDAMKKIDGPRELELLESIITLKVEDGDTNSLQILEKEEEIPVCPLSQMLPLLRSLDEDDENQPDVTCDWTQSSAEDNVGETPPDFTTETASELQNVTAVTFPTGYTTMEMFQQMMPSGVTNNTPLPPVMETEPEEEEEEEEVTDTRLNYIGQLSYR